MQTSSKCGVQKSVFSYAENIDVFLESGQLIIPSQLALNFSNITHAGPMLDIANILSDVCELDIAANNISQWQEVHFTIFRDFMCLMSNVECVLTFSLCKKFNF